MLEPEVEAVEDNREFLSTGIEKLDYLLEGGLQKGFTTLISGISGSNLEIITKQIATTEDVIYITTDETKEEIISAMNRFSWDSSNIDFKDIASKHLKRIVESELKRIAIHEQRSKNNLNELIKAGSEGMPPSTQSREDYLAIFTNNTRLNASKKIIASTLDFFLTRYNHTDVLRVLQAAKAIVSEKKGALILIMTRGIHGTEIERRLELLCDCVLELDVIQKGATFERLLTVKKVRNYAKKIGTARYDITDTGFMLETIERIL
jgi:KaiC/GvpD/RAD55 family RecA-like ATPase